MVGSQSSGEMNLALAADPNVTAIKQAMSTKLISLATIVFPKSLIFKSSPLKFP